MLAASVPAGPINGDDGQRAAREELSRVMYHRDDPSIVDRVFNWVGDRLSHLVDGSVSGSALLLVVILLVGALTFAIIRAGRPRRTARTPHAGDPLAPRGNTDHRRLADQLTREGKRAEALREWLRAAIADIERRGILEPRPGRTGSEIAREAGAVLPAAADALVAATTAFDEVWFGERPAVDADVVVGQQAAEAVRRAHPERRAAAAPDYAVPR